MPRNSNRSRNNNPSGRNQYSSDWMDTVKDRPIAAAAVAAASVGAGVFLWSKRNQISNQLSNLSDQISDWTEERGWTGNTGEMATAGTTMESSGSSSSRSGRSTSGKSASGSRSARGQSAPSGQAMNAGSAEQGVTH